MSYNVLSNLYVSKMKDNIETYNSFLSSRLFYLNSQLNARKQLAMKKLHKYLFAASFTNPDNVKLKFYMH